MGSKTRTGYRDSRTGEFITRREAERRPWTTQRESIPKPGYGDTGRSRKKRK